MTFDLIYQIDAITPDSVKSRIPEILLKKGEITEEGQSELGYEFKEEGDPEWSEEGHFKICAYDLTKEEFIDLVEWNYGYEGEGSVLGLHGFGMGISLNFSEYTDRDSEWLQEICVVPVPNEKIPVPKNDEVMERYLEMIKNAVLREVE